MPFLRPRKPKENRWKDWDQNAQKNGLKNTVYTVNGDEYTGEWRDNKKHGKIINLPIHSILSIVLKNKRNDICSKSVSCFFPDLKNNNS